MQLASDSRTRVLANSRDVPWFVSLRLRKTRPNGDTFVQSDTKIGADLKSTELEQPPTTARVADLLAWLEGEMFPCWRSSAATNKQTNKREPIAAAIDGDTTGWRTHFRWLKIETGAR